MILQRLSTIASSVVAAVQPTPSSPSDPYSSPRLSHNNNSGDQCNALLHFSNSFSITWNASQFQCDTFYTNTSYPRTSSWKKGTDCCSWDGVTCHAATNYVTGLDLSCSWLQGPLRSNSTLFSLHNLRRLNLAGNDFQSSPISPRLGMFTRLTHLNLSNSNFMGPVPLEMISHLSGLISLDLSSMDYVGLTLIDESGFRRNLTRLRELVLDGVDMSGIPPISLTNLSSTSITSLSLRRCGLQGVFPIDIFHLPNLRTLSISYNFDLTGTLPETNWTTPLVSLYLSGTNFRGPIPASVGNLTSLLSLDLSNSKFNGSLDFEMFARLKSLQYLSLALNNLTVMLQNNGNCSFPRLQHLDLNFNRISGPFPDFLSSTSEMRVLDLANNMISGQIPEWFWRVGRDTLESLMLASNNFTGPLPVIPPSVVVFEASGNNFTGEIPSSICRVTSLSFLDLSNNRLNGTIPRCLGDLSHLDTLTLSNNQLQGPLPRSLANCTSLKSLDVGFNGICDTFPHWLVSNTTGSLLETLNLQSNKFHGVIETPLPHHLSDINLSNNNFFGKLPINFSVNLNAINLANNYFDGALPIPPPTAWLCSLSNNRFSGDIPYQICNATQLGYINLSNNSLTGSIPQCFKNLTVFLFALDLRANHFVGQIGEIFAPSSNLRTIRLSQNRLGGTLPLSLGGLTNLKVLDLSENELEDNFPNWLDNLPDLQVLNLRSNKLHGPVDTSRLTYHPFTKLRIFDISNNMFFGPLPVNYIANFTAMKGDGKNSLQYMSDKYDRYLDSIVVVIKGSEMELVGILTLFITIDFSRNSFQGEIPEVIGDLKALKELNFSHNNLSEQIPSSLGNLSNLESLDLSSNKFSGEIPRELEDIKWLSDLNLSDNRLVGPIPESTQFDTFKSGSFDGNPGLCGHPLPRACGNDARQTQPSTSHEEEEAKSGSGIEWRAVPMGYGCGLAFGISAGYVMLEIGRPRWLVGMVNRWLVRLAERKRRGRKTNRLDENATWRNRARRRRRSS